MGKQRANLGDISELLEQHTNTVIVPQFIDVPNTEIVNRAQILDPTEDLGCRRGIERVSVTQIGEVPTEYDVNGKEVWRDANDPYDRIRFVGGWRTINSITIGKSATSSQVSTEDYLEVVFYGTGLNLVISVDAGLVRDYRATVDGGGEGADFHPASPSNVLVRQYRPLQVLRVVSGLSQGIHTVKVREATATGNINLYGYEIENGTSTIQIAAGELIHRGKKYFHTSAETVDVDDTTPFDIGTQGTKGGLVQISLKPEGIVRRDLRAPEESSGTATTISSSASSFVMDASPPAGWEPETILELDDGTNREYVVIGSIVSTTINLRGSDVTVNSYTNATVLLYGQAGAAVNRTNEEIWRTFWPREFGTWRSDDFLSTGVSDKNFTLDDCGTSLGYDDNASTNIFLNALYGREGLIITGVGDPTIYFDFYGTGISVLKASSADGGSDTYDLIIDGKACTSFPLVGDRHDKLFDIVSDLPLGWHQLAIRRVSAATWEPIIHNFVVYGPKAPDISDDEVPLSQYCLQGDFKQNTIATSASPAPGPRNISRGAVRHSGVRELIYIEGTGGTANWANSFGGVSPTDFCSGQQSFTDRGDASYQLTFFGFGFECRFPVLTTFTNNILVELDDGSGFQTLNTTNFPGIIDFAYGGAAFNSSTGILNQNNTPTIRGAGFSITDLPEQLYTVRCTNQAAGSNMVIDCIDTFSSMYYPVQERHPTQNYTIIGSNSLRDLRELEFDTVEPVNALIVEGQTQVSTTNTLFDPVPNMVGGVYSHGAWWRISFSGMFAKSVSTGGASGYQFQIRRNGIPVILQPEDTALGSSYKTTVLDKQIYLPKGFHFFLVEWIVDANVLTCAGNSRRLLLEEIR